MEMEGGGGGLRRKIHFSLLLNLYSTNLWWTRALTTVFSPFLWLTVEASPVFYDRKGDFCLNRLLWREPPNPPGYWTLSRKVMKWTQSLAKSLEWIFEAEWVTMYCQNKCVVQIQQVISRQHLPGKRFRYQKHRKGLYINLPQGREAWERFTTTHATWLETCISQPRFRELVSWKSRFYKDPESRTLQSKVNSWSFPP